MKTSTKRKIDDLGRVVIPMDFREELNIKTGDPLEVYIEGEKVVFKKLHRTDLEKENERLKERIRKACDVAYLHITSSDCPEYEEMHNALKAVMDALRGE